MVRKCCGENLSTIRRSGELNFLTQWQLMTLQPLYYTISNRQTPEFDSTRCLRMLWVRACSGTTSLFLYRKTSRVQYHVMILLVLYGVSLCMGRVECNIMSSFLWCYIEFHFVWDEL